MTTKEFIIDIGSSVTDFVSDMLSSFSIPGLSLASLVIKRSVQTYEANQYLKNEGIKHLVVFKHMCNNIEVLVSRQPKTDELTYVYDNYKGLRKNLDDILDILSQSLYSDVLKKSYDDYPGPDNATESLDKVIKLELIPAIVNFISTELSDNKIFSSFVDMHLDAFDNDQYHDVWLQMWQTTGFSLINNSYIEFIDGKLRENKSLLSGSGKLSKSSQEKLDEFKKNMERWQLYMDTLSSFTQIEDIHLFLTNYKALRSVGARPFDIVKFAKKFMVDPIKMQHLITGTIQSLDIYTDSMLTLTRVNQTGGSRAGSRAGSKTKSNGKPQTKSNGKSKSKPKVKKANKGKQSK